MEDSPPLKNYKVEEEEEDADNKIKDCKPEPKVQRLFPDHHVQFGDGGEADLKYPVYSTKAQECSKHSW